MYGYDILYGISKGTFETANKLKWVHQESYNYCELEIQPCIFFR